MFSQKYFHLSKWKLYKKTTQKEQQVTDSWFSAVNLPLCRIPGSQFCTKQGLDLHHFAKVYALILDTLDNLLKAVL